VSNFPFNTGDVDCDYEPLYELEPFFREKHGNSEAANAFWFSLNEMAGEWFGNAHLWGDELPPQEHADALIKVAASVQEVRTGIQSLPAAARHFADEHLRRADLPGLDSLFDSLARLRKWANVSEEGVRGSMPSKSARLAWAFDGAIAAHWNAYGELPKVNRRATKKDFHGLMVKFVNRLEISKAKNVQRHLENAVERFKGQQST
jgi:hypothetical protein